MSLFQSFRSLRRRLRRPPQPLVHAFSSPGADKATTCAESDFRPVLGRFVVPGPHNPRTLNAALRNDPDETAPTVFDPALKHFQNGYRPGDPAFAADETGGRWHAVRRGVMAHLLRGIAADTTLRDRLVLRGGVLMHTWFGDRAREPHDLDFTVAPNTLAPDDPAAKALLRALVRLGKDHPAAGGATIRGNLIATDSIWTYERAEGRRILYPWTAPGLPPGSVQIDVVFREPAAPPTEPTDVRLPDGTPASLLAASRSQSLAWKLMWLYGDSYPQAKDLYDAVLLAESTELAFDLLAVTLATSPDADDYGPTPLPVSRPLAGPLEWGDLAASHPDPAATAAAWAARLHAALAPTFAAHHLEPTVPTTTADARPT